MRIETISRKLVTENFWLAEREATTLKLYYIPAKS